MEQSINIAELAKALAKFQGMVESVSKDAVNPFFKSKYATLENIVATIKKPLSECGLSFAQLPTGENGLTTILIHESGEFLKSTVTMHPSKNDPQGQGSAITYMRRYALSALLGLVTDEDDDGNEASTPKEASKSTSKAHQAPKATLPTKDAYTRATEAINKLTDYSKVNKLEQAITDSHDITDDQKQALLIALDAKAEVIKGLE